MGMGICCLGPKGEMHVIDWLEAQNEDPVIQKAIEWVQLELGGITLQMVVQWSG